MTRFTNFRWVAALTLAIAMAPGAASAQENGTVKISGTLYMDWVDENVGDDLAQVFANGHAHTWTLTLYGTTQSHSTYSGWFNTSRITEIHARSFDLEFFGPDAATLNGIVRDHMAGAEVWVYLENSYSSGFGNDFARMFIDVFGEVGFSVGIDWGSWTLFPADVDGYPVVGPEPFSIWAEYSGLWDGRPGNSGAIWSDYSLVTFEGRVGGPEPILLAVADASILEGNKGTSNVAVTVTLSRSSDAVVTVKYATANGTAVAPQDYTATSGTLTFQPGQTVRTISVSIKGDKQREPDETLKVRLSNAVGTTIGSATVTILNDD